MALTFTVLGLAHWAGLACIVLGYVLSLSRGVIGDVMVWGARLQLLIGLALVGVAEMGGSGDPLNHAKVGAKLVVALAVVALCEIARGKAARGQNSPMLMHVAAGLTLVNVLIATMW